MKPWPLIEGFIAISKRGITGLVSSMGQIILHNYQMFAKIQSKSNKTLRTTALHLYSHRNQCVESSLRGNKIPVSYFASQSTVRFVWTSQVE